MPPPSSPPPARSRASAHRRWLMLALGWTAFAIGAAGAVLPLVPTTPFMLIALWAFSLGSERFHAWLWHHRVFGPPLRRFREERIVPLPVKVLAVSSMAASLAFLALATDAPWYALALTAAVMAAGAAVILRFPSRAAPRPLGQGVDP